MTELELFIQNYQFLSYVIIFVGIFFIEADIFFLTAALFAEQGYLQWIILMPIAYFAIILGDLGFYYLGLHSKRVRLGIWFNNKFRRVHNWVDENFMPRYNKVIYFGKFVTGIARFMPFLAGWHRMPVKKFLKIHLSTSFLWLLTVTAIGLILGNLVNLIGPREVFGKIWIFFLFIGASVFIIDYFLKKKFVKKIKKRAK